MNRKGSALIITTLIIIGVLIVGGFTYYELYRPSSVLNSRTSQSAQPSKTSIASSSIVALVATSSISITSPQRGDNLLINSVWRISWSGITTPTSSELGWDGVAIWLSSPTLGDLYIGNQSARDENYFDWSVGKVWNLGEGGSFPATITPGIYQIKIIVTQPSGLITVISAPFTISSTTLSSSTPSGWKIYNNQQLGFQISYPSDLILGSDTPSSPVSAGYVSGTPEFFIGTMSLAMINTSPGKPNYSGIYIQPTQCYLDNWGMTATSSVVINGTPMTNQMFSATHQLYFFAGNPENGWDANCNTIQVIVSNQNNLADPYGNPENWNLGTYENILQTFKFISL